MHLEVSNFSGKVLLFHLIFLYEALNPNISMDPGVCVSCTHEVKACFDMECVSHTHTGGRTYGTGECVAHTYMRKAPHSDSDIK